jgi:zinc transporter 2
MSDSNNTDTAIRKMLIISGICIIFLITELIGGILANSLAIISDAAHLFSDLSGFMISIAALWIGKKKANSKYTFGYYRAEVIGALISVITIWILTYMLVEEAVERIVHPIPINAPVMLLTAIIGLVCNLAMMKVLHSSPHGPHAGCSHGHGGHSHHGHEHDHSHNHLPSERKGLVAENGDQSVILELEDRKDYGFESVGIDELNSEKKDFLK